MSEHQVITLDFATAFHIATNAVKELEKVGKEAFIVVVDHRRNVKVYLAPDNAKDCSHNIAYQKADQSAATGKRTSTVNELVASGERIPGDFGFKELVPWAGGVPIYDEHSNLLGAIGISGLTEIEDEQAAVGAIHLASLYPDKRE